MYRLKYQITIIFFIISLSLGCEHIASKAITVKSLELLELSNFDAHNIKMKAHMNIKKNNSSVNHLKSLKIKTIVKGFEVRAKPLRDLYFEDHKVMPLVIDLNINPLELPEKVFYTIWRQKFKYSAKVSAEVDYLKEPIDFSIKRTIKKNKKFTLNITNKSSRQITYLDKIANFSLNPSGVNSKIHLSAYNPFTFPMEIKSVSLGLKTKNIDLGTAHLSNSVQLTPKQKQGFILHHSYSFLSAHQLKDLFPFIDQKLLNLSLTGTITVETKSGLSVIPVKGTYQVQVSDLLKTGLTDLINLDGINLLANDHLYPSNKNLNQVKRKRGIDYEKGGRERRLKDFSSCSPSSLFVHVPQKLASKFEANLGEKYSLSFAEEKKIGSKVVNKLAKSLGATIDKSSARARYVQKIGRLVAKQSKRNGSQYEFYILKGAKVPNAMAIPGGYILITDSFLDDIIENEAQLAGVLGHEVGHLELRHSTAILGTIRSQFGHSQQAKVIEQIASNIIAFPYSAAKESDADTWGIKASYLTGYSALTLSDLWKKMDRRFSQRKPRRKKKVGGLLGLGMDVLETGIEAVSNEVNAVVNSHPESAYRACTSRKIAAELQRDLPREYSVLGTRSYLKKVPALP